MVLYKTDASNKDFRNLVAILDAELKITDGDEHEFYNQYNKLDEINHVIVAYEGSRPVGCGAIKKFDAITMEVKRMFVIGEDRGRGVATKVLKGLEQWTTDLGFQRCILETGTRQEEALALYKKNNYKIIANYGQYKEVSNSVCFEKKL